MNAVLLVIQVLLAAGLVATILMQRSEGGALGIGGGGPGGAMGARGAENLLTRATMLLGAAFIANSILLAVLASVSSDNQSVIDRAGGAQSDSSDFPITFDDAPTPDAEATAEDEPAADGEPASQDEPDIPGR
jgi:preprotein translocase subunit SecG